MYWITIYHVKDSGEITKYGTGSQDEYALGRKLTPADALAYFWKYEHYIPGDGWDWAMTPEEFNAKFAEGIRILHMEFMPQYGFRGTSLVEIQLDRIGHERT